MSDTNILDKSMRSVFVGNIPYEATEEKLKDIFNEVGPVLSFKLVYDRETGKPKGYGFCEYKDQETALSAMRNLNGYEIGGRSLRVDNACTEKSRLEMQSLLAGPPVDNTYGEPVDADKAPEEISKAVASLPPEQMFELMKQMKLCIQNNPAEGKQMLLQNPQLAYALLQAQVVMRIVDPQVAITMLHKANPSVGALQASGPDLPPQSRLLPLPQQQQQQQQHQQQQHQHQQPVLPPQQPQAPPALPPPQLRLQQQPIPQQQQVQQEEQQQQQQQQRPPPQQQQQQQQEWIPVAPPPPRVSAPPPQPTPPQFMVGQDMDMRALDPRTQVRGPGPMGDQDLRIPPIPPPPPSIHPSFQQEHPAIRDPRERYQRDPRSGGGGVGGVVSSGGGRVSVGGPPPPVVPVQQRAPPPNFNSAIPSGATDQEKAALIMQVLQLSDEQIAMLPPEQRQSILVLKEQIAKSTQR